ncbi:MAG: hypothetical protein HY426_03685 [Candidatus Levybacteria bacterium]|nr:hypothetical protein [Candidatus Levybacteria bacterium]
MDIQKLREIFDRSGTFAVVVGPSYGLDEMGAALSIYLTLISQGKDVSIISSKEPLVEVSNLVGIDRVKSNFESKSGDLIVSFPYQENEIGKVSYTLEGGFLNIIVKPKENSLSFGERDVLFKRSGEAPSVLIALGVKKLSELSVHFNIESLKDTTIVNIDKNGANEGFGDVVVIGQGASSVSEQVANILVSLAYPMDLDIAQNLMSGIVEATADFQSSQTSSLAFEMAGVLLRNGAIRENIRPARAQRAPSSQFDPFGMPAPRSSQALRPGPGQTVPPRGVPTRVAPPQAPRPSSAQPIREFPREQKKDEAPPDWLSPKIYKGSTNVE